MRPAPSPRAAAAGFSLIELLAVILIVGVLAAVLVSQLGGAEAAADTSRTKMFLTTLDHIIGEYETENGRYPPSSFTPEQGVANDGENVGVEALVVALYSNRWDAGGTQIEEQYFGNTDEDLSARSLTDFGNKQLLELLDAWGNPIAYIHRNDYGVENRAYLTLNADGVPERGTPKACKDPLKGQYYKNNRYQLISAGADGLFNTEDDITNFERN
jgi:prepilin-type N-terminal cleavage/methylation domain-containing protein